MSFLENIDVPPRRTDRKHCQHCEASAAGCRAHRWMTGFLCCPACFGNHDNQEAKR
jgi:hypothetical protein